MLTTIDENAGLELYINVPVQQATGLKAGLPVRIVDDDGKEIATEKINFVSPSVDPATQSVLVKAPLAAGARFRTDQFVRAQVVWTQRAGAHRAAGRGGAHQRAVLRLRRREGRRRHDRSRASARCSSGPIVGNDYVVLGGLKAGRAA